VLEFIAGDVLAVLLEFHRRSPVGGSVLSRLKSFNNRSRHQREVREAVEDFRVEGCGTLRHENPRRSARRGGNAWQASADIGPGLHFIQQAIDQLV
jgi:hypothetical protein